MFTQLRPPPSLLLAPTPLAGAARRLTEWALTAERGSWVVVRELVAPVTAARLGVAVQRTVVRRLVVASVPLL